MSAALMGSLFGAFIITGLLSRVLDKYAFKAQKGATKAIIVAVLTLAIALGVASFTMGIEVAALYYMPTTAIWFVIDLVRALRAPTTTTLRSTPPQQGLGTSTPSVAATTRATPSRGSSNRAKRLLYFVVSWAAAAGAFFGVRALMSWYSESQIDSRIAAAMNTPYERSLLRSMKTQGVYRQYVSMMRQLPDSSSASAAMATATRRGVTLLGPEDQARRIELVDHQLAGMTLGDCAAIQRGSPDAKRATLALITSMDSVNLDLYTAIVARAFQSEEQNPGYRVPPVDQNETISLLKTVAAGLPEPDKSRYFAALGDINAASDTDACWAGRMLNRFALSQDAGARASALRLLTLLAAQEPSQ